MRIFNQGSFPLVWEGVRVTDIGILESTEPESSKNNLVTFWSLKNFNLNRGLDLRRSVDSQNKTPVSVCAKHLDHQDFEYSLNIVSKHRFYPSNVLLRRYINTYIKNDLLQGA
jgi:hypothetical protein